MLPALDGGGSRTRDTQDEAEPWWKACSRSWYRGEIVRGILFFVERNLSELNPKKWES